MPSKLLSILPPGFILSIVPFHFLEVFLCVCLDVYSLFLFAKLHDIRETLDSQHTQCLETGPHIFEAESRLGKESKEGRKLEPGFNSCHSKA